jgi:hypothetical protein
MSEHNWACDIASDMFQSVASGQGWTLILTDSNHPLSRFLIDASGYYLVLFSSNNLNYHVTVYSKTVMPCKLIIDEALNMLVTTT